MAKRKRISNVQKTTVSFMKDVNTSIRLTGAMNQELRLVMEKTGLSLNSLVTVALADYLRDRGHEVW